MAKRKKGRSRKGRRKRAAPKSDRSMPVGASIGMGVGGIKLMTMGTYSVLDALQDQSQTLSGKLMQALNVASKNIGTREVLMPVVVGIGVSAAPKIPVVRMLAKPADKAIKRVSKNKAGL